MCVIPLRESCIASGARSVWASETDVRDVKTLTGQPYVFQGLKLDYIMSHLASSEDPYTSQNDQQRQLFESMRALLPPAKASLRPD